MVKTSICTLCIAPRQKATQKETKTARRATSFLERAPLFCKRARRSAGMRVLLESSTLTPDENMANMENMAMLVLHDADKGWRKRTLSVWHLRFKLRPPDLSIWRSVSCELLS